MNFNPLFDPSQFVLPLLDLGKRSWQDELSEVALKNLQDMFSSFAKLLEHPRLAFLPERNAALEAVGNLRFDMLRQLHPVVTNFQRLQHELMANVNQRMLPGFTPNFDAQLAEITKAAKTLIPSEKSNDALDEARREILRLPTTPRPNSLGISKKSRKKVRALKSSEPLNTGYKSTNIGFLAILEHFPELSLTECDDDEL